MLSLSKDEQDSVPGIDFLHNANEDAGHRRQRKSEGSVGMSDSGYWRRLRSPLIGRRRFLISAGAASAFGSAMLSAGCNTAGRSERPSGSSQAGKQPKRGGVLVYAGGPAGSSDSQGRTFDPDIQTQFAAKNYTLFYERLLAYNLRSYKVEPELAQRWEQPAQDAYVFHLQPNVKWQNKPPVNGRPLTSDDIVYSLERARTDDPKFFSRSLLTFIDKIEAPDKATVRVTTKGPYASTLTTLSVDNLAVLSKEVFDKYPKPLTAESAVGTGPFLATNVEEKVGVDYQRNPDYWKPGLPYLDGVRTKSFSDVLSAWAAFTGGQVDVTRVPGPEVKGYIAKQGPGYTPDWFADDSIAFQYPNTTRKPMDDKRIPRALRLLIDHDEFRTGWTDVVYGRGGYGSIFPTALSDWDLPEAEYKKQLEWKQPKDDAVKEAMSLLTAAGYSKDNPLKFTLDSNSGGTEYPAAAQLIQAQWKKFSQGAVDVELKLSDSATVQALRPAGQFTYGFFGHSAGMVDPDIWLSSTYRTGGSLNFARFSDPQADALIDKQRTIFDEAQRKAVVKEIILYMIDHGPSTIGANRYFLNGVRPRVQGYVPEYNINGRQYQSIWLSG
jgi:peptide/nickel transport system substrate-binding protein